MKYKANFNLLLKLLKTKKTFFLYNTSSNKIDNYILTDNLTRYRNSFQYFKLVEVIKPEINKLTLTI